MASTFQQEHADGAEPAVTRGEERPAAAAEFASDLEVKQLQANIDSMNAAAQRLENEIAQMLAETGGAAANTSEFAHAKQAARDMHGAADGAKAALTNAPTDPRTGRKMISAKQVAGLSNTMLNLIIGGQSEGARIETAIVETQAHAEAQQAKEAASPAKKIVVAVTRCAHATACALGIAAPQHHWYSAGLEEMDGFGARVSRGVASRWHGFTGAVSGIFAGIAQSDPIGTVEQALGSVREMAGTAVSGTMALAKQVAHSVKDHAVAAVGAVGGMLSHGRAVVAAALDRINPFGKTPAPVVAHAAPGKAHAPIHVPPSAMEKAMAQAKALVTHALPHLSVPHLADFVPASVPSLQGVMAEMGLIH